MADGPDSESDLERVIARLLRQRLAESLTRVEAALARWRAGEVGVFEAHSETLRHGGRAGRLAERMADADAADGLVREAFECGLIERDEVVRLTGRPPEELPEAPVDDEPGLPGKRDVIERLIQLGPVLVHIDARRSEVSVPERFRGDPRLVLRFGYGLTPEIVDLVLDDAALCGTLSFGGVPHRCVLPWTAIYAVVGEADQKGMVWPDDVPSDAIEDRPAAPATAASPPPKVEPRSRGHLRLVD